MTDKLQECEDWINDQKANRQVLRFIFWFILISALWHCNIKAIVILSINLYDFINHNFIL